MDVFDLERLVFFVETWTSMVSADDKRPNPRKVIYFGEVKRAICIGFA